LGIAFLIHTAAFLTYSIYSFQKAPADAGWCFYLYGRNIMQIEAVILTRHIIASTIRECWAVVVDGFDAYYEQAYDPA
jgi:hypothetical protein